MEEISFENYWMLFNPIPEYSNRRAAAHILWDECSAEKKQALIEWLKSGKPRCSHNPYFFIMDFRAVALQRTRQELSFAEYYAKYGTTEEMDGWKMENPTGRQVIYVKN